MGFFKKEGSIGITIRITPKLHEKIKKRAMHTRRSFHQVLQSALELSFSLWEKGDDILAERNALRAKNKRLEKKLKAYREKTPDSFSPSAPANPSTVSHVSPPQEIIPFREKEVPRIRKASKIEQDSAFKKAQIRLKMIREQQEKWTKNLQFSSKETQKSELKNLKKIEASIPVVTTELIKGHKSLLERQNEREELITYGRARGVAFEESEKNLFDNEKKREQEIQRLEEEELLGDSW